MGSVSTSHFVAVLGPSAGEYIIVLSGEGEVLCDEISRGGMHAWWVAGFMGDYRKQFRGDGRTHNGGGHPKENRRKYDVERQATRIAKESDWRQKRGETKARMLAF